MNTRCCNHNAATAAVTTYTNTAASAGNDLWQHLDMRVYGNFLMRVIQQDLQTLGLKIWAFFLCHVNHQSRSQMHSDMSIVNKMKKPSNMGRVSDELWNILVFFWVYRWVCLFKPSLQSVCTQPRFTDYSRCGDYLLPGGLPRHQPISCFLYDTLLPPGPRKLVMSAHVDEIAIGIVDQLYISAHLNWLVGV